MLLRLGICVRHLKFEIEPVKEGSPHDRQLTKAHSYPLFFCGFKNLVHAWFYHTIARAAFTSHKECWEWKCSQYRLKRCPSQEILEACTWPQSILQPLKCPRYRYVWYKLYNIGHNALYKASTGSLGLRQGGVKWTSRKSMGNQWVTFQDPFKMDISNIIGII
jgi:hypothetical protein